MSERNCLIEGDDKTSQDISLSVRLVLVDLPDSIQYLAFHISSSKGDFGPFPLWSFGMAWVRGKPEVQPRSYIYWNFDLLLSSTHCSLPPFLFVRSVRHCMGFPLPRFDSITWIMRTAIFIETGETRNNVCHKTDDDSRR